MCARVNVISDKGVIRKASLNLTDMINISSNVIMYYVKPSDMNLISTRQHQHDRDLCII